MDFFLVVDIMSALLDSITTQPHTECIVSSNNLKYKETSAIDAADDTRPLTIPYLQLCRRAQYVGKVHHPTRSMLLPDRDATYEPAELALESTSAINFTIVGRTIPELKVADL
ncbi:hypothetical protein BGZ47_008215 [Haplosporangium gracile]|nr:hypothetical protein BGZ47_008215 [Haplosporangium gracile]